MTPPTAKPLAPADAPAALHAAIARRRGGPSGVRVVSSRSADGTDAAAAAPCRQRAAVSSTTEPATAPSSAPAADTTRLVMMVRRWPNRSPSRAPSISRPPKNMAYPPDTRLPADAGAFRSASILGSAVTTMVTPSTSTNCTEHNAVIARLVFRSRPLAAMFQPLPRFFGNKPSVKLAGMTVARWSWLGDRLALDAANTVRRRGWRYTELITSPADLRGWLARERGRLAIPTQVDAVLVARFQLTRDHLLRVLRAAAGGA